ncbi:MAG: hypothetical protein RLY86_2108 [Pseudomonadota bacterium]|jgi:nucleotide-binding universal stress UspA family protein
MGYKTILVHLGPDGESDRRLRTAIEFARRQDAHLRGLHILRPVEVPGMWQGINLTDVTRLAKTAAEPARDTFLAACARDGVRGEWLMEVGDAGEHLAQHTRYADAVIISQDRPKSALDDYTADLPEHLPFACSAPVLVLPRGRDSVIDPAHVVIAWKSSREAAGAVRDALPLLKEAEAVTVLTVVPPGDRSEDGACLSRYLAEHGVNVTLHAVTASDHEVGQAILAEAKALGAGLIVMGVYGHSRLRVRILGGVSKHVLEHSPVPMLVTH